MVRNLMLHRKYVQYLFFNASINVPDNLVSVNGRWKINDHKINEQNPLSMSKCVSYHCLRIRKGCLRKISNFSPSNFLLSKYLGLLFTS